MNVNELTYDKFLTTIIVVMILLGAYNTIMTAIKNRREEKKYRESPVMQLKERVDKHDELLNNDKERMDKFEKQLSAMGQESKIMLRGVRSLLSHEINGNSTDKLEKSMSEIDDYLISRK